MSQQILENDYHSLELMQDQLRLENFCDACWQWHEPIGDLPAEPDFLVEGFLPSDYLMILSGKTKEGQSSFLSAL